MSKSSNGSKGSITLHPTKGVNARLTYCCRCGGESPELVLIGARDFVDTCNSSTCGCRHYGGSDTPDRCVKCSSHVTRRPITDYEKLPSSQPCDQCKKLLAVSFEAFKTGGILVRCKCGAEMVLKGTAEFAINFRAESKTPAPAPVGAIVDHCPNCDTAEGKETPSNVIITE